MQCAGLHNLHDVQCSVLLGPPPGSSPWQQFFVVRLHHQALYQHPGDHKAHRRLAFGALQGQKQRVAAEHPATQHERGGKCRPVGPRRVAAVFPQAVPAPGQRRDSAHGGTNEGTECA